MLVEQPGLSRLYEIFCYVAGRRMDIAFDRTYVRDIGFTVCCTAPGMSEKTRRDMVIDQDVQMTLPAFCKLLYQKIPLIINPMLREYSLEPIPGFHYVGRVIDMERQGEEPGSPAAIGEGGIIVDAVESIPDAICEDILLPLTANLTIPPFAWCRNGDDLVIFAPVKEPYWLRAVCNFKVIA